jgi:chorismate synthase
MSGNTIGKIFCLTTFGESHGEATGGVIDGCPAGLNIDYNFIQKELDRRKPGQSDIVTARKESDKVKFISGIFKGKTLGTPIGFIIKNTNQHTEDYEYLKDVFRPSHADYTYQKKYGIRDYRGGGRASARETVARVVAGAVAKLVLNKYRISIKGYVSQIGDIKLNKNYKELDLSDIENNIVRCPDQSVANKMIDKLREVKLENDSIGGIISCVVKGVATGLGEPVFDKLSADLSKAMLSINAAKGFDYGSGFEDIRLKGSEQNDIFIAKDGKISTITNYSGGIQGGISNGEDIYFRVAFKPVATILKKQKTVDIHGDNVEFEPKGRHDICVLPRVVPVVEAMAAIVLLDHLLRNKTCQV